MLRWERFPSEKIAVAVSRDDAAPSQKHTPAADYTLIANVELCTECFSRDRLKLRDNAICPTLAGRWFLRQLSFLFRFDNRYSRLRFGLESAQICERVYENQFIV